MLKQFVQFCIHQLVVIEDITKNDSPQNFFWNHWINFKKNLKKINYKNKHVLTLNVKRFYAVMKYVKQNVNYIHIWLNRSLFSFKNLRPTFKLYFNISNFTQKKFFLYFYRLLSNWSNHVCFMYSVNVIWIRHWSHNLN